MTDPSIVRVGHRGAAGHAPENTIAALERGIALGADFLEIDLQRTKDGCIVLMHDKLVDRTTDGHGCVAECAWHELQRLDAGEGQHIPLLEEALDAANGRAGLILECVTPGLGVEIWQRVMTSRFQGPVIFASFLHQEVRAIRELDTRAMTMALIEGVPVRSTAFALEACATHAGIALDSTTMEFVDALHRADLSVFIYTADTAQQIDLAIQLGADGIISDFPDRLRTQICPVKELP